MDQERAKKLFDYGATFIFLDVPEGTEFGMDCNVWTLGPKFKGVKMMRWKVAQKGTMTFYPQFGPKCRNLGP